jgi:3',5'-cyclic AMP phosphodiesterase CpdA
VIAALGGVLAAVPEARQWLYYDSRGFSVGAPEKTWPVEDMLGPSAQGARVAVVGDPGTGDANEYAVTRVLADQHQQRPYDGLVLLGDLIYPDGDVALIDEVILEPFAPLLEPSVSLMPVLGNHDYESGDSAAILRRLGRESAWYAEQVGPVLWVVLDSEHVDDPAQTAWLVDTLAASSATWTIVATHHPPYSAGVHGSDIDVREAWSGLFAEYGVDLALAGHDHDYQRSEPIDGVTYVVSGGGAKIRPTGREYFTQYAASTLHYLDLQVSGERLYGQAINTNGEVFDAFSLRPNR